VINYRYATLYGFSEKANELIPVAYRRKIIDLIPSIRFTVGSGLSAWVASKQKPILLSRIHTSPQLSHRVVKSFISIPFISNGELMGVLNLGHSIPGAFTMDELEMGIRVSEEIGGLLKRYLLLNDLYALDSHYKKIKGVAEKKNREFIGHEEEKIEQLATAVSHHINNPLTSIIGNAQLLLADLGNTSSVLKNRLQKIIDESDRIASVIEELRNIDTADIEDYIPGKKMIKIKSYQTREYTKKAA
jgi:signal transduction histidine kinase